MNGAGFATLSGLFAVAAFLEVSPPLLLACFVAACCALTSAAVAPLLAAQGRGRKAAAGTTAPAARLLGVGLEFPFTADPQQAPQEARR